VVVGDLPRALGAVRAHDLRARNRALDPGEQLLHRLPHVRIVDTLIGGEHDLAAEPGTVAEPALLQQLLRLLALGPREGKLVAEHTTRRAADEADDDEEDDPGAEDTPAAAVTGAGKALQHGGEPLRLEGGLVLLCPLRPSGTAELTGFFPMSGLTAGY